MNMITGCSKSDLVEMIYVDATRNALDVRKVIGVFKEIGAISAYAYLGDVGISDRG